MGKILGTIIIIIGLVLAVVSGLFLIGSSDFISEAQGLEETYVSILLIAMARFTVPILIIGLVIILIGIKAFTSKKKVFQYMIIS